MSVQENVLTTLASLTAVDEDQNQLYTFRIINQPGDNFIIVGDELRVRTLFFQEKNNVKKTIYLFFHTESYI